MPYNYAHALAGREALTKCPKTVAETALSHADAFYLGTLGPDPYYGDLLLPFPPWDVRADLADTLHNASPRALFSALLELCMGDAALVSYALGFACHLALDMAVHPYIEGRYPGKRHSPAEIAMDWPLVQRLGGWPACAPKDFYELTDLQKIDALHAGVLRALTGAGRTGLYARALQKWIRVNTFTFNGSGKKSKDPLFLPLTALLVGPRGAKETARLLNLTHTAWRAPFSPPPSPSPSTDAVRTSSVPELVMLGAARAAEAMTALCGAFSGGSRETALSAAETYCDHDRF